MGCFIGLNEHAVKNISTLTVIELYGMYTCRKTLHNSELACAFTLDSVFKADDFFFAVDYHSYLCIVSSMRNSRVIVFAKNNVEVIETAFFYSEVKLNTVAVLFQTADHAFELTCCCVPAVISIGVALEAAFFKFISLGNIGVSDYLRILIFG